MTITYIKAIYETQDAKHRDLFYLILQSTIGSMASILRKHRHDKNKRMTRIKDTSRDMFRSMPMASKIISIMTTCKIASDFEPEARPTSQILRNTSWKTRNTNTKITVIQEPEKRKNIRHKNTRKMKGIKSNTFFWVS